MLKTSKIINRGIALCLLSALLAVISSAHAIEEIGSDSRIRTFIYGKNDVYRVITSFGYQTTIELENDEKIKTISLGNSSSFKVTPKKNRIFIRTLQEGQLTNMIVITDKRTYQIELSSITESLDEIMYVVKFYYPENFVKNGKSGAIARAQPNQAISIPQVSLSPINSGAQPSMAPSYPSPMQPQMSIPQSLQQFDPMQANKPQSFAAQSQKNYNYTVSGPEFISPVEVYDNGMQTFIKFSFPANPDFYFSTSDGKGLIPDKVNYQKQGDYYVLNGVAKQITTYFGSQYVCIYNESIAPNYMR